MSDTEINPHIDFRHASLTDIADLIWPQRLNEGNGSQSYVVVPRQLAKAAARRLLEIDAVIQDRRGPSPTLQDFIGKDV
jgi:hypothetical protein